MCPWAELTQLSSEDQSSSSVVDLQARWALIRQREENRRSLPVAKSVIGPNPCAGASRGDITISATANRTEHRGAFMEFASLGKANRSGGSVPRH
jgi:hypothetical protein